MKDYNYEIKIYTYNNGCEIIMQENCGETVYNGFVSNNLVKTVLDGMINDPVKFIKEEKEFKEREQNYRECDFDYDIEKECEEEE